MTFISVIAIGLVVGLVARLLMPGDDKAGCLLTILLGVGGAFVGGYLGRLLGLYEPGEPASFAVAVVGAMVILFAQRLITGRK